MRANINYKFFSVKNYIVRIENFSLHATSKARNEFRLELNEVLCMDAFKEDLRFFVNSYLLRLKQMTPVRIL